MAKEKPDLVYGTLDMLILKALQHDPRHGLAIADRIQQMSKDILYVEQGSLYPALYRLEAQGWIKAEWGVSDNNRKARYYKLTAAGRKQLAAETEHWPRITKESISFFPEPEKFMPRLRAWFSRLIGLFRKIARDAEMAEEMQAHLDLLIERNVAAGMSPDDARSAALRQFGGIEQTKESRANNEYGDGPTNFCRTFGSACECSSVVRDFRSWRFSA